MVPKDENDNYEDKEEFIKTFERENSIEGKNLLALSLLLKIVNYLLKAVNDNMDKIIQNKCSNKEEALIGRNFWF